MRAGKAWWTYQLLCAFFTIDIIVANLIWFWRGDIGEPLQDGSATDWLSDGARVVLLLGCIGALVRRKWAARVVATSGVWVFASGWTWVPGLIDKAILDVSYARFSVEAFPLMQRIYPYVLSVAALLDIVLVAVLVLVAHSISMARVLETGGLHEQCQRRVIRYLPLGGILLIGAGLFLKRLALYSDGTTYVMAMGSWLVLAGCILLVIWQVRVEKYFVAACAAGFAVTVFLLRPVLVSTALTVGLWLPALGLGIVALFGPGYPYIVRAFGLILPIVLTGTGIAAECTDIPMFLHFTAYAQTLPERPPYFPAVLVAPDNAKSVTYCARPVCRTAPDTYSLGYFVPDPYPSEGTRRSLREYLTCNGWLRLKYDLLNPKSPLSKNPAACLFPPEEPNLVPPEEQAGDWPVVWREDWVNERDEHVSVSLSYELNIATGEVARGKVHVDLTFFGRKSWIRRYIAKYKEIHPEEFNGTHTRDDGIPNLRK